MPDKENTRNNLSGNTTAMLITCMGIAVLLWIANKFSQEYNTHLNATVQYINVPNGLILRGNHSNQIQLTVKTKGFTILSNYIVKKTPVFDIDAFNLSSNASFILTDNLKSEIAAKLPKNTVLINISPDTLFYSFEKSSQKSVKVELASSINFLAQYGLASPVVVEPLKIMASGAKTDIQNLKNAITETVVLNNVKATQKGSVKIKPVAGITFTPNIINYTIPVTEYTEQEIDVPVSVINQPDNIKIELFPKKIKLKCMVSLHNFEKIKPELFQVIADFSKIDLKRDKKVSLQLVRKPTYVKNTDFYPNKVEYIVYKK